MNLEFYKEHPDPETDRSAREIRRIARAMVAKRVILIHHPKGLMTIARAMHDEGSTQMVPEELSKESMTEEKVRNILLALCKILPDGIQYEFRTTRDGRFNFSLTNRKVGER